MGSTCSPASSMRAGVKSPVDSVKMTYDCIRFSHSFQKSSFSIFPSASEYSTLLQRRQGKTPPAPPRPSHGKAPEHKAPGLWGLAGRVASAMPGQNKKPGACGLGLVWWVGLRLLIFPAPVAAGLQKSERGPCSSSAVSAAGSASLAQQYRTRTGPRLLCPGKTKTRGLRPRAFVLVDGTGLEPVTSCTSSRCSTS